MPGARASPTRASASSRAAIEAGHTVSAVPGPSAATMARHHQRAAERPPRVGGLPSAQGPRTHRTTRRDRRRDPDRRALRGTPPDRAHPRRSAECVRHRADRWRSPASSPNCTSRPFADRSVDRGRRAAGRVRHRARRRSTEPTPFPMTTYEPRCGIDRRRCLHPRCRRSSRCNNRSAAQARRVRAWRSLRRRTCDRAN